MHFYQPQHGHGLPHDPFNAIVGPRPIGWVSTQSTEGIFNVAPYSFFNAFNYRPPLIGFASSGYKDTVRNAEATGEFCWQLVTRELAEQMNQTSAPVPPEVDEAELAGLLKQDSTVVSVPHLAQARVVFECRVSEVLRLRAADGTHVDSWFTVGEVVGVHIDERLLVDGVYQTGAAEPVMRGGGPADYFSVTSEQCFQMRRPSG